MLVSDLIRELERLDGDAEVRLAFQPQWPLEYRVGQVVGDDEDSAVEAGWSAARDDDGWYVEHHDEQVAGPYESDDEAMKEAQRLFEAERESIGKVVWIGEADQIGYLHPVAARKLGWR